MKNNILITGGAGFIGSSVVRHFVLNYPDYNIVNLDILSYSSNIDGLRDLEKSKNYNFVRGNICDSKLVEEIFFNYKISAVIHLAAESHVDRSIKDPILFAKTNILGTLNLLISSKKFWGNDYQNKLFYHISTDEVFGSLPPNGYFSETSSYDPHSPYAASKASSDHFVKSFYDTYGLPVIISNCSNNFGPNQFEEKLIPLSIKNIIQNKKIPIYGDGKNSRDWIFIDDHVNAIDLIFHQGTIGETYNIGGSNEFKNIDLVKLIISISDEYLGRVDGSSEKLIEFVEDRLGHDFRYAIDSSKIKNKLGWKPSKNFINNLRKTIYWYIDKYNSNAK